MEINKKALKTTLIITYIFIVFLIFLAIALPWLVTWYVETMGRKQTLPTIIMLTCYPCVPFAFLTLVNLRKIILNMLKEKVFVNENSKAFKKISVYCMCISVITFVAGFFYLPFFIVFLGTGFFSAATVVFKNIIDFKN